MNTRRPADKAASSRLGVQDSVRMTERSAHTFRRDLGEQSYHQRAQLMLAGIGVTLVLFLFAFTMVAFGLLNYVTTGLIVGVAVPLLVPLFNIVAVIVFMYSDAADVGAARLMMYYQALALAVFVIVIIILAAFVLRSGVQNPQQLPVLGITVIALAIFTVLEGYCIYWAWRAYDTAKRTLADTVF